MLPQKNKVVLIGLDGAPHPLVGEWMEEGILPNLRRMRDEGAFGCLMSSVHPISPIAWNSIVTGKNAGKHGVYDFCQKQKSTYDFEIVNSYSCKSPAIWDHLTQSGESSIVFNVPVTYPAKEMNGLIVTGLLTPTRKTTFTYPESLSDEIRNHVPNYFVPGEDAVFVHGRETDFVDALIKSIEAHEKAILYLIDKKPDARFFMFVLMQTDAVHHKMWRYIENRREPSPELDKIKQLYRRADQAVGRILEKFDAQTNFILVSDHGGGALDKIVSLNQWLIQKGWMKLKKGPGMFFKRFIQRTQIFSRLYQWMSRIGLGRLAKRVPGRIQQQIATSFASFQDVDWSRTRAYAFGKYGQIYLNLKGREPQGIIEPGKDYEQTLESLQRELLDFQDPKTGEKIIEKIFRREELYQGDQAANSPDLIFSMAGYRYDASVDLGFLDERIFKEPEFHDCGTHRLEGIVAAWGPGIRKGVGVQQAHLLDIAPTVFKLLGYPMDPGFDGKVLSGILENKSADGQMSPKTSMLPKRKKRELTEKEKEEIEGRLRSLGYLG